MIVDMELQYPNLMRYPRYLHIADARHVSSTTKNRAYVKGGNLNVVEVGLQQTRNKMLTLESKVQELKIELNSKMDLMNDLLHRLSNKDSLQDNFVMDMFDG